MKIIVTGKSWPLFLGKTHSKSVHTYPSHCTYWRFLYLPPPHPQSTEIILGFFFCCFLFHEFSLLSAPPSPLEWWDAVLQKRLAWALLVLLLSTLVCCQPTELILASFFFFHDTPLPPLRDFFRIFPMSLFNEINLLSRGRNTVPTTSIQTPITPPTPTTTTKFPTPSTRNRMERHTALPRRVYLPHNTDPVWGFSVVFNMSFTSGSKKLTKYRYLSRICWEFSIFWSWGWSSIFNPSVPNA